METQLRSLRYSADLDSSKYVAGMNAKVAADRAGAASSAAVGVAIGQADQRVSAAGDPLVRLSRQYVEGFRGAEQFNRAVATLGRGIDTGNIPLERADAILDGIYRKYGLTANAADLMERGQIQLAGAVTAANARWAQQAGQIDTVTAAANRLAVANDNVGAGGHNTANIAAQFQDIGVTSAMGMSPIMIALQQGTQLSAALQASATGLRGTVTALGGAFASVFSPVSLLTIGVIALGAAGIQALMGIGDSADDATSSLENHSKWLDTLLAGYSAAKKAASDTADAAARVPQGIVESDLQRNLTASMTEYVSQVEKANIQQAAVNQLIRDSIVLRAQSVAAFPDDESRSGRFDTLIAQAQELASLDVNAKSTAAQLENVMGVTDRLMKSASDPAIKSLAETIYNLAAGLRTTRGEMSSTQAALAALQMQAVQSLRGFGVDEALAKIRQMTPELRSAREQVADIFTFNAPQARTMSELQALADAAAKFNAGLTEQERRQKAIKDARSGGKTINQWDAANDNFQQRIDQTRMEIAALGQSTYTVERNKSAFDLLNQAKQAGIPIDEKVTSTINRLAGEYASTQVALEAATAAQQRHNDMLSMGEGAFVGLAVGMSQLARSSEDFWSGMRDKAMDTLGSITDEMVRMAATDAFRAVTGQGGGAGGMGGIGSWIAGLFGFGGSMGSAGNPYMPGINGPMLNANGNVYQSPNLSAYSNAIVSRPTMFAFAQGAGLMGEAGEEAIMPLRRNRNGQLGVQVASDNGERAAPPGMRIEIHNYSGQPVKQEQTKGADGIDVARIVIGTMKSGFADGSMDGVMAQTFGLKRKSH